MNKKYIFLGFVLSCFICLTIVQTNFFQGSINENLYGTEWGNPSKIEKGPFKRDSGVQIQELSPRFALNGNVYLATVENHLGAFNLPSNLKSNLIEIKSTGFYFNEITGLTSSAQITLGSYSSLEDHIAPNINILTTLAQKRIKYLVLEEKKSFLEAEAQAKVEVLKAFRIPQANIKNFDELTIMGNTNGDAILLALSVVLQGNQIEGELSSFISNIREDLKDNGKIDSQKIYDKICHQTQSLNPILIRENLIKFYHSINLKNYHIPSFEDFLDSDCDGIVNGNDPESLIFSLRSKPDIFSRAHKMSIQEFDDKVWIYSGSSSKGMQPLIGLYYSENLLDWKTHQAEWSEDQNQYKMLDIPVMNSHLFEYQNKLWIYGGNIYDEYKTFFKDKDYFFINNFHNITKDLDLNNFITGIRYDTKDNRFFELPYNKGGFTTGYSLDELNSIFQRHCSRCTNVLRFQFPDYLPNGIDGLKYMNLVKSQFINQSSSDCHKIIEGENRKLYRFGLKKKECKDKNINEGIAELSQDGDWNVFLRYSELFYDPVRDLMEDLNLDCNLFKDNDGNYDFHAKYCDFKPEKCRYRLLRNCQSIHEQYGLENFDNLFILNEIQDIAYFKGSYYFIANNLKNDTWNIYKIKDPTSSIGAEILFEISNHNLPLVNQFSIYEDHLFVFNAYGKNKANLIYSTKDGKTWETSKLNYYNRYINLTHEVNGYTGVHNPFLYKKFIHRVLAEDKISIIGKYKYYRDYIHMYFNKNNIQILDIE